MNKNNVIKRFPLVTAVIFSVLLSVLINLTIFCMRRGNDRLELYPSDTYTVEAFSCSIGDNGSYSVTGDDPQLIIKNINAILDHVQLRVSDKYESEIRVQVYYKPAGDEYSEDKSVISFVGNNMTDIGIDIPKDNYSELRIDIDGNVDIESLTARTEVAFSFNGVLLTEFLFLVAIVAYAIWKRLPEKADKLSLSELLFWLLSSGYFFLWSCTKPYNYAPDEYMRYSVSRFIFDNNRLPIGAETCDNPWGFSYAQMPTMLCNYLGYIPMKLVSIFTNDEYALVVASRFGSVICGSVCLLFMIKAAKLLIKKPFHWVMIVFMALMPQFCFLCSYINNDICALCGAAMILYSWVRIAKEGWHSSLSVIMAVGIGICGISYYNSYGWVLMCIIMLLSYIIINKDDRRRLLKQGVIIAGITLAIMAFPFIRQYVIFGDFLGFKATAEYGEMYAMESLKPSVRRAATVAAQGIPLTDMLFDMGWLCSVYKSFIGMFGYMQYPVHPIITRGYFVLLCGMAAALVYIAVRNVKNITWSDIRKEYRYIIFYICIIGSMVIPVILSIIYSYTNDYQAQGRYIYSMMPGLALFFGTGYSVLSEKITDIRVQKAVVSVLCGVMVFFNGWAFLGTYLPS